MTNPQTLNTPRKAFPIAFLCLVAGLIAGFITAKAITKTTNVQLTIDPFYESQVAQFNGQVIRVDAGKRVITVKNKKGETRDLVLADPVAIVKPSQISLTGLPSEASNNLKDIELNKDVGVVLQVKNGQYKVTNIISATVLQGNNNLPSVPRPSGISSPGIPFGTTSTSSATPK